MHNHDVISAFIDDEPFDERELATALADPAGRELLFDLLALRHVVQPDRVPAQPAASHTRVWLASAAAALVLCASAGYLAGRQIEKVEHTGRAQVIVAPASDTAPPATRVIELKPGINWHDSNGGY